MHYNISSVCRSLRKFDYLRDVILKFVNKELDWGQQHTKQCELDFSSGAFSVNVNRRYGEPRRESKRHEVYGKK